MTTISNVQAPKYGSAASNSVTVPWTSTPTPGNLLIARAIGAAATDGGAITGWTRVDYARYGATSGYVAIFVKVAGGSEGDVTVTFTSATTTRLEIEEWSSSTGWPATPADQYTHSDNAGSTVTSKSTGTTGTTVVADELSVAVWGAGSPVTGISFTNSFTLSFEQPTGSLTFWGAHKVLSATGTVETTASWTTARLCGAAIGTFRPNYELTTPAGTNTPTGALIKEALKALAGSITPTGALSTVFTPGGTVYNQSADGGSTPAGTLIRSTSKLASGTVAPSGSVDKSVAKSLSGTQASSGSVNRETAKPPFGSVTTDGAVTKSAGKLLSGAITGAGTLLRQIAKALSGDAPSAGEVTKSTSKAFAGALSSSGALATVRTFVEGVSGSLALAGALLRQIGKALSGAISSSGETTKSTSKAFSGSAILAGVLTSIRAFARDVSGDLTSAGAIDKVTSKSPTGILTDAGSINKAVSKSPAGSAQPSGSSSFMTGKGFPGTLSPSGVLSATKIPGSGTVYNQSTAGSIALLGSLATLFTPGAPAIASGNVESWGGAFADDINPRPRRRTAPEKVVSTDDEEAMVAILLLGDWND